MQDRSQISELMDRASSGDDDAFAKLAEGLQDRLYRFALAHLLHATDAAEAVQETLLRAYRRRDVWKPGSDAWSWMAGIAMNVVRECRRRRRRREVAIEIGDGCLGLADMGGATTEAPTAPQADPPAMAQLGEDLDRLARAIARLPDRQREALTCRYLRQMSVRETAQAMDCAEGTVKAAVAAAMQQLRSMMSYAD